MSEAFDPYRKWLGIPVAEQPPHHYRLLAIELFEDDPDVIESAADQRMGHVRVFQTGPHSALSQKLLNELSAAKLCLLNPQSKADYDAQLRCCLGAAQPARKPVSAEQLTGSTPVRLLGPAPATESPVVIVTGGGRARPTIRNRRAKLGPTTYAMLALVAMALSTGAFVIHRASTRPQPRRVATLPAGPIVEVSVRPKKEPDPKPLAPEPQKPPQPSDGGAGPVATPPHEEVARVDRQSDGFVPLFNGTDLTGWKTHPSQQGMWRVENGVLVGSGPAACCLYSERDDFKNFHLRVEARINRGGNSGIFFRSKFEPSHTPERYEVEIVCTDAEKNETGSLIKTGVGPVSTVALSQVSPNEWITLELIAVDNHISVRVNGQTTAEYTDPARSSAIGHIAVQQNDSQTVIEFRKIEISEDPQARSTVVATEPPESTPLVENRTAGDVEARIAAPPAPKDQPQPADSGAKPKSLGDLAKDSKADAPKLTATQTFSEKRHTAAVTRVAFHRTRPVLASAGKDGRVLVWDLETGAATEMHLFHKEVWAVKFTPDGSALACANRDWDGGSRLLFKTLAGVQLNKVEDFKHGGGAVGSVAYSPDGRLFAAGQDDGTIRLWDVAQLQEIDRVGFGERHAVYGLAFGPVTVDRKTKRAEYLLAAACEDGVVRTLTATLGKGNKSGWTFKPTGVEFPKAGAVLGVRFSRDGKLVGFTRVRGNICLCDARSGAKIHDLAGGGGGSVEWIAFHPLQPWCVTAHKNDQVARIWNTKTAELLCELRGHEGGVMCAEFSPDGRRVATASEDFTIKLWDLAGTGVPASTRRGRKSKVAAPIVGD